MAKKYYWLKLMNDFFAQPKIKKLRRIAGGDTYTIIYLKMQLLSLQNEGKLYFENIEDNFIDEIALTIDEEPENVAVTIQFLSAQGLIETEDNLEYLLTETRNLIGSETDGAERVRKHRQKKAQKALQCNNNVIECNTAVTSCNTDIDIDIEKEKEKDIDIDLEKETKKEKQKETRHRYGMYSNVLFTDSQLSKLKEEFPNDWSYRIDNLSEYMKSTGKSYKDHLATIRAWARKEKKHGNSKDWSFMDL